MGHAGHSSASQSDGSGTSWLSGAPSLAPWAHDGKERPRLTRQSEACALFLDDMCVKLRSSRLRRKRDPRSALPRLLVMTVDEVKEIRPFWEQHILAPSRSDSRGLVAVDRGDCRFTRFAPMKRFPLRLQASADLVSDTIALASDLPEQLFGLCIPDFR